MSNLPHVIAAILAASALSSTPVLAQQNCAPIDQVEAYHAQRFEQTRVAQAVLGKGKAMLITLASKGGATWAQVILYPDRTACFVAGGTDWQLRSDPAPVSEDAL